MIYSIYGFAPENRELVSLRTSTLSDGVVLFNLLPEVEERAVRIDGSKRRFADREGHKAFRRDSPFLDSVRRTKSKGAKAEGAKAPDRILDAQNP